MHELNAIAPACAVLLGCDDQGRFEHVASAWCVNPGEWVSAWPGDEPPAGPLRLLSVQDGRCVPVTGWEHEDGLAGFSAALDAPVLRTGGAALTKRTPLWALGWPSTIDHPAFSLSRGSLDPERYFPYLCPWPVAGHCALFSAHDGWLTGRCHPGMEGGPVLDAAGSVVGVLVRTPASAEHPPLARFRRLG